MVDYNDFLNRLEPINERIEHEYTLLAFDFKIEAMTEKAVLVDGEWLPLSQMRVSRNGDVYMKNWLYDKYMWE